jgi:hypothetical protein
VVEKAMSKQALGLWSVALVVGCSAGGVPPGPTGRDGGVTGVDAGTSFVPDAGFAECESSNARAMTGNAPVDIVWVVDSSGSMSNEAARVQDNLNDFSAAIGVVGIDYHVVMITTSSYVSVPPPLGGGPNYLLIDRPVSSHEPLQALLDEFPRYEHFLRRSAVTHVVATTDDESDLGWMEFDTQMTRNLGGRSYYFHAIASEVAPVTFTNPRGACTNGGFPPEGAAAPGIEYYTLADHRGGLKFSICTDDWSGLFRTLTAAIAVPQPLPCVYPIPDPPDGMELDPFRVNVVYTPSDGTGSQVVPYVGTDDGVDCTRGGWYYDDPGAPSVVQLCPSTCSVVGADLSGEVSVAFGCQTLII